MKKRFTYNQFLRKFLPRTWAKRIQIKEQIRKSVENGLEVSK